MCPASIFASASAKLSDRQLTTSVENQSKQQHRSSRPTSSRLELENPSRCWCLFLPLHHRLCCERLFRGVLGRVMRLFNCDFLIQASRLARISRASVEIFTVLSIYYGSAVPRYAPRRSRTVARMLGRTNSYRQAVLLASLTWNPL